MVDSRDPQVQALVVELAMSAEDAPSWEAIESKASRTDPVPQSVLKRNVPGWAAAVVAALVALVSIGGTLLLLGTHAQVAETPSTVITTISPPVTRSTSTVATNSIANTPILTAIGAVPMLSGSR